jgi:hypothetical protein
VEYSPDMVRLLVPRVYAPEDRGTAVALLAELAATPHINEVARVQVAVIKLSDGSLPALRRYIRDARADYRDVLAWAEFPAEMRTPVGDVPRDVMARVRSSDRAQYAEWLAALLSSTDDAPYTGA